MRKYLFVVHSSITWRMALAVMDHHDWPAERCVLLTDRNFQAEDTGPAGYDISSWSIQPLRWAERTRARQRCRDNRRHRAAIDRLLEQEIGAPFFLYIPHTWSYPYLALREHPLCERYFLLEEGTLSYRHELDIYYHRPGRVRLLALRLLLNTCGAHGLPAFPLPLEVDHPRYGGCYGMHEDSFPSLPADTRVILPPPFRRLAAYAGIRQVLITGPWLELAYCTEEEYRLFVNSLFQYFSEKNIRVLHVKFHPLQYARQRSIPVFWEMYQPFRERLELVELGPESSPEEIAFSSQADFYLAYSSVAVYASRFGCRIFSYAEPLAERWPAFRRVYQNLPDLLTKSLIPIDLTFVTTHR